MTDTNRLIWMLIGRQLDVKELIEIAMEFPNCKQVLWMVLGKCL